MPRGVRGINGLSWGDLNYRVIWRASYDRAGMADAVAHGVTKTTPNATERLGPPALWPLYDCLITGLNGRLPPFAAALVLTLRLMTSRELTRCGLYWRLGGVTDSTTVTKPAVHAVMVANHVNPKLQTISCQ